LNRGAHGNGMIETIKTNKQTVNFKTISIIAQSHYRRTKETNKGSDWRDYVIDRNILAVYRIECFSRVIKWEHRKD
jgi:hypothetical protein